MNWNNVKEITPPIETGILVTDGKYITVCELRKFSDGEYFMSGHNFGGYEWEFDFYFNEVTHWMELPKLPQSNSKGENSNA